MNKSYNHLDGSSHVLMSEDILSNVQSEAYLRSSDRRLHMRQRVLLSCLKLKDDNGGIILDISEQGLAMQAAKGLGDDAYAQLRFQLSQSNDWIEVRGRIAWMNTSRQAAGVEFIDLSYESLMFIKNWISSIESQNIIEEENAIPDSIASPKSVLSCDGTGDVTSIPETSRTDVVVEELVQELITEELAAMLPSVKTKDAGGASENSGSENERRVLSENVGPTKELELTLCAPVVRSDDLPTMIELADVPSRPGRYIGLLVGIALLLTVLVSIGYSLRKAANGLSEDAATSSGKLSEAPSNRSTSSIIAPNKTGVSSDAGFILQVAALRSEKSAVVLAGLLQQKGFPAYVFKPAAAKLYRVLVGPYRDANSTVKLEEKLRKQGFEAIRTQNPPAQ